MYLISVFLQQQSQQYPISFVLVIGGILGALLTGIINIYILKLKNDQTTEANRIRTYSQLKGNKKTLQQTFMACGDYAAIIEFNQATKSYLEEKYKDDPLAIEYIEKIEGIDPKVRQLHDRAIVDLTKARESWWKNVGLIQALCNDRDLVQELIESAKKIEICEKNIEDFIENFDDINNQELPDFIEERTKTRVIIKSPWLKTTEKELHRLIDEDLGANIDALLDIVKENLYNISLWERLSQYLWKSS